MSHWSLQAPIWHYFQNLDFDGQVAQAWTSQILNNNEMFSEVYI
jgi:hypothetical protein